MLNAKLLKVIQLLHSKKLLQLNQQFKLWLNPQINTTDYMLKLNLYMKNYQMLLKKGDVSFKDDVKARAKKLNDDYEWDKNEALKIWCFGPEN